MAPIGGYMRVSAKGDRDPDKWLTVPHQRKAIERWAQDNGHTLVDVREDIDKSGGDERANLEALVCRIESGELEGLVVAKLDRFSRSMTLGIKTVERIDKAGGFFVAAADGFDLRTDEGRWQFHGKLTMADYELRRFKTGWKRARETMIMERGQHWGPSVPLGYQRGDDGRLALDPKWAPVVREMFERRARGESASTLARWLDDQGFRTARDGVPGRRYVRELLKRPVYLGTAHAGEFIHEGAHPEIVSRDVFERAQAATAPRPSHARGGTPSALSGLVRCHACRYSMSVRPVSYASGPRPGFQCRGHHAGGECPSPAFVMEGALLPLVEAAFFAEIERTELESAQDNDRLIALTTARAKARHAFVTYRDDPDILAALPPADYAEGLRVRRTAHERTAGELATEMAGRPDGLPAARDLRRDWPQIDVQTKRRMLAQVFGVVAVKRPQAYRGHGEPLPDRVRALRAGLVDGLPRPGRNPRALVAFPRFEDPSGAWISLG